MISFPRLFTSFGLMLSLAACSSSALNPFRADIPEPCPPITILKSAASKTAFQAGDGRDLIDIDYEASLSNVYSACDYSVDYDTRAGKIFVQVAPEVRAQRGPANSSRVADIEYFVALVDPDQQILNKNVFTLRVGFPGNLTRNQVREEETVTLTIPTDGNTDGSDYQIFVGFQLDEDQLDYNVKQNAR